MKLYFDVIYSNKLLNDLMIAMDLFDQGKKNLGDVKQVVITISQEIVHKHQIDQLIRGMVRIWSEEGKNIVFIGYRSLEFSSIHIKPGIQTISDGNKYGLFKDILTTLGYKVETTDIMEVISAIFIGDSISH